MPETTRRLLNHGWEFRQTNAEPIPHSEPGAWLPAQVPGHVHLDLMDNGVIPDPFLRMNERTVQWVDDADWEYRTTFEIDPADMSGTRHLIRFNGLDTIAEIQINDRAYGPTDNQFVEHEFSIRGALQAGTNTLTVRFKSAERIAQERKDAWFAEEASRYPKYSAVLPRTFVRKAQYSWGWDWGPILRGVGIWQDVELIHVPTARIERWSYDTTFNGDGSADVTVNVVVDGTQCEATITLAGTTATTTNSSATIHIDNVQRWWPNGFGDAHLYDLRIELEDGVDAIEKRIGLREIELVREPDDVGEGFFFRVNGVDVWAKGANWIPDDSFPARTTRRRHEQLFKLATEANMNMIRIWGGGLYETEDFYDVCDELGLMVWQDFTYACALYADEGDFATAAAEEATKAVRRLRNHPSLALYCGNNENQWLTWMGAYGSPDRCLGDNLYDNVLPAVVAAEDPARHYWPSSPYGTSAPGDNPSSDDYGDSHYWNVWHGEGDWVHYRKCTSRFVSEFGFSAPPAMSTLEGALDPSDLGVDTPGMRWHDKTGKGYQTYLNYISLHYPESKTANDLVYYGQLNQAQGMSFGIEHFRRLRPHNMGTLVWQLNDCWPVQSWAWVDYNLIPKAAYYASKRFYADLLVSPDYHEGNLTVTLCNDAVDAVSGELVVRVIDAKGGVSYEHRATETAEELMSREVLSVAIPASTDSVVHCSFAGVENLLYLAEPKDLTLPAPSVSVTTRDSEDGVIATFSSDTLALAVMLTLDGCDAEWSDNFFNLLPGESREVTIRPASPMSATQLESLLRFRTLTD